MDKISLFSDRTCRRTNFRTERAYSLRFVPNLACLGPGGRAGRTLCL